jgi:choline dehydrogenase
MLEYAFSSSGKWSSNFNAANGFLHTKRCEDSFRPDIQFHVMPFDSSSDHGIFAANFLSYNDSTFQDWFGSGRSSFMILPGLLRPKSRGNITLASTDVNDAPIIDMQYLSHDDDLHVLVEGMKIVHSLEKTETFKRYKIKMFPPNKILCGQFEAYSDDYYACYVRNHFTTIYHPVSTCSMGTVVDHKLRVNGIGGLRVVDASVMPLIVGGNTNAATIMIGEKGADMILEDWRQ